MADRRNRKGVGKAPRWATAETRATTTATAYSPARWPGVAGRMVDRFGRVRRAGGAL